jgi:Thioredoxin like C-terminal domain
MIDGRVVDKPVDHASYGKPIVDARGTDVGTDGVARFDRSGMIRLVAGVPQRRRVLTLASSDPGLRAYVFTFGP